MSRKPDSTVADYEGYEPEDDVYASGLGSKLKYMYKRKLGALSATQRRQQHTDQEANEMFLEARTTVDKLKK